LPDYHSNEIAVQAARQGARRPNKKGYSVLKKRELDNSSKPNLRRAKAAYQRKILLVRKSYSL
jgi:hypothetical protein